MIDNGNWIGNMRLTPQEKHLVEVLRMRRKAEIELEPKLKSELVKQYGVVYSTEEMNARFKVLGFLSPFVVVRRRLDDALGSLEYQSFPRFYFNFLEDKCEEK